MNHKLNRINVNVTLDPYSYSMLQKRAEQMKAADLPTYLSSILEIECAERDARQRYELNKSVSRHEMHDLLTMYAGSLDDDQMYDLLAEAYVLYLQNVRAGLAF